MTGLLVVHSALETVLEAEKRAHKNVDQIMSKNNLLAFAGYFNDAKTAEKHFTSELNKYSSLVIFVSSGGTEEIIDSVINVVNKPVLMWAYPKSNSLAASIEVYAVLKEDNPVKLFYSDNIKELSKEIERFVKVTNTIEKVNSANLGMIGEASPWLLTSRGKKSISHFKTKLVNIDINKIPEYVNQVSDKDGLKVSRNLKKKFNKISVSETDLLNSSKVYLALKTIIKEYNLNSMTIKCFDLLPYNYTACMGVSMCNDDEIVTGCEGDLLTTFTMMIGSYITDKPCWMANPSSIDRKSNLLVLAHCTVPIKMLSDLSESELVSHMESDLSTAIQGPMKRGEVTIFRVGGNFEKMLCTTGRIIETDMKEKALCRTQVVVALDGNVDSWLDHAVGNHQVIVYGDITDELKDFCRYTNIQFNMIND
ncbi:MAG: hypothetical protein JEY94_04640 [Melioribacteraceae bacterium]|nr:hypothetical protein [Melioribacteraceae bacterium]